MSRLEELYAAWQPRLLSILRIVAALLFMEHGTAKLLHFPHVAAFDNLEIVSLPRNAEAHILKLVGKAHAKRRLKIRSIPLQFAELPGLPPLFILIPSRVEHEDVRVELGIGQAVNRP